MLQLSLGITFELVRCCASFSGLVALSLCLGGIVKNEYPLFEHGLLAAAIAIPLAIVGRLLRRYEL
ncbi:MAG: hypothetical protein ACEQSB_01115 [Undibacterium sp.]